MSMSMHVILDTVPKVAEWQTAITDAGFDLALDSSVDITTHTGFLPARFDNIDSGFEFDVGPTATSAPDYRAPAGKAMAGTISANFRWSGDILELCCAFAAASALAKLSQGVLYQAEDGTTSAGDEAIEFAKAQIADVDGMY